MSAEIDNALIIQSALMEKGVRFFTKTSKTSDTIYISLSKDLSVPYWESLPVRNGLSPNTQHGTGECLSRNNNAVTMKTKVIIQKVSNTNQLN